MAEYTLVADKTGEVRLAAAEKRERYRLVHEQATAVLDGESDLLVAMTSLVCLLHNAFPYFYWTGFYRRVSADELLIGPYQGTLGCLRIHFSRGVCGAVARSAETIIVDDVSTFPGHIACDSASASEIVVPVVDSEGVLIAVLDVDSSVTGAFDETDREGLEAIVGLLRTRQPLPLVARG
jgi:GAF domain-containing protein